jgi:Tol biopolymer transport system component
VACRAAGVGQEPDNRYQNARDLRNDLRDLKQELDSGTAERALPAPPSAKPGRPWTRVVAGAAAAVALAAVLLAPRGTSEDANRPAPAPQVVRFKITDPMPAMPRPEGAYHSVAISQDGSLIAYGTPSADGLTSGGLLYLRPLNGSSTPIASEVPAFAPFFAPDGSRIGFRVGTDRYFVTSVRGGTPLAVTGSVLDAFTNAVWSGTDALIYESYGTLYRKSFSGDPEVVASPSESNRETWYYGVSLTPDGKAVLFSVVKDDMPSFDQALVAVRDLRTGSQKVLLQGGMSPSLTSTGHLLFGRAGTLYAVEVNPATWEVRGSPVPVIDDIVTEPNDGVAPYAVSRNGTLAYLQGRSQPFTRRVMALDRQGRAVPFNMPPGPYIALRMSPDGRQLALSTYGANVHTWLYDLQRETLERLTETWSNEGVEWSRDGKHIAQISTRGGEQHLVLTSVREPSNELRLLTSRQIRPRTAFSADDRYVIFSDGADLFRLRTDGSGPKEPLVTTRAIGAAPAASPDGRWLAFAGWDTGTPEVYLVAADGQGRRQQISRSGGTTPLWTKGGKELCFRSGLTVSCVAIGPDGAATGIQATFSSTEPFEQWDVSPDGERFYLLRTDVEGRQMTAPIQVVVNWFEELRAKMER